MQQSANSSSTSLKVPEKVPKDSSATDLLEQIAEVAHRAKLLCEHETLHSNQQICQGRLRVKELEEENSRLVQECAELKEKLLKERDSSKLLLKRNDLLNERLQQDLRKYKQSYDIIAKQLARLKECVSNNRTRIVNRTEINNLVSSIDELSKDTRDAVDELRAPNRAEEDVGPAARCEYDEENQNISRRPCHVNPVSDRQHTPLVVTPANAEDPSEAQAAGGACVGAENHSEEEHLSTKGRTKGEIHHRKLDSAGAVGKSRSRLVLDKKDMTTNEKRKRTACTLKLDEPEKAGKILAYSLTPDGKSTRYETHLRNADKLSEAVEVHQNNGELVPDTPPSSQLVTQNSPILVTKAKDFEPARREASINRARQSDGQNTAFARPDFLTNADIESMECSSTIGDREVSSHIHAKTRQFLTACNSPSVGISAPRPAGPAVGRNNHNLEQNLGANTSRGQDNLKIFGVYEDVPQSAGAQKRARLGGGLEHGNGLSERGPGRAYDSNSKANTSARTQPTRDHSAQSEGSSTTVLKPGDARRMVRGEVIAENSTGHRAMKRADTMPCRTAPNIAVFNEVIRNKEERRSMQASTCVKCKGFFEKAEEGLFQAHSARSKGLCQCSSRHRHTHAPPMTPPGFWSVGNVGSSQDSI